MLIEDDIYAENESREIAQLMLKVPPLLSNSEEVLKPKFTVQPKRGATGSMSVKLPRLDNGNPSQWRSFWDSFEAAVGKDKEYSYKISYCTNILTINSILLRALIEHNASHLS